MQPTKNNRFVWTDDDELEFEDEDAITAAITEFANPHHDEKGKFAEKNGKSGVKEWHKAKAEAKTEEVKEDVGTSLRGVDDVPSGEAVRSLFQDTKTETKASLTKRVTAIITNLHEFYNDCHDRTDGKFCKEGGKEVRIEIATPSQKKAARTKALEKIRNAPAPTKAQVKKAREELRRAKEEGKRAGGESRGGSAAARRQQAFNLFKEFGGLTRGYVIDHQSGLKMHYTSDPALNPRQYPTFERGKIWTKYQGGGYQLPNLIPESFDTNRSRLDRPVRKGNDR